MSSGSNETIAGACKNKDPGNWLTEPPKNRHLGPRDLNALMISGESYNPSEIGEAVQLSVVEEQRGTRGPVKQTYVQNRNSQSNISDEPGAEAGLGDDEISLFSSSTVHLGRLDTIKSAQKGNNPPEISVSTSLEEVIPPRLTRRPVSEVIPLLVFPTPSYKNHRHRFSLNISDDLDKLMETASVLTFEKEPEPQTVSRSTTTSVSRESFQTADDLSLDGKNEPPLTLPKRPNAQSLRRAREVSESLAQRASNTGEIWEHSDVESAHSSDRISAYTWQENQAQAQTPNQKENQNITTQNTDDLVKLKRTLAVPEHDTPHDSVLSPLVAWESSFGSLKYDEIPYSDTASKRGHGSLSSKHSWTPLNASISSKFKADYAKARHPGHEEKPQTPPHTSPRRRGTVESYSDLGPGTPAYTKARAMASTPKSGQAKAHENSEKSSSRPSSEQDATVTGIPQTHNVEVPHTPETHLPYPGNTTNEAPPKTEKLVPVDDDGYYDIEEPVIVSHPTRAKLVRDNIRGPPRKGSHRRSRRFKLRETAEVGAPLKPFSYNTLVHLLESMNGTVIGEEFEMLNLPIQEKQLIEKVIDLLSRLTLDMVTDKHRFEIGLQRLEKAHRVLEGFL